MAKQTRFGTRSILMLAAPVALVVLYGRAAADDLFVASTDGGTIFSTDGASSTFDTNRLHEPTGLAFDAAGNLFVANNTSNSIVEFSADGVSSIFANTGLSQPRGMAIDNVGNIYVANWDNSVTPAVSYIEKFTPQGVGSVFANTGLATPWGLAFDKNGNLYVANGHSSLNNIEKFAPDGTASVFATGLNAPFGLAFDQSGNLFVSNFNSATIMEFDPSGAGTLFANTRTLTGGQTSPAGLAFDSAGNLYVANVEGGQIEVFAPNGTGSLLGNKSLASPTFMAFAPQHWFATALVPEPASLVLLGGGIIVLLSKRSPRPRSSSR